MSNHLHAFYYFTENFFGEKRDRLRKNTLLVFLPAL